MVILVEKSQQISMIYVNRDTSLQFWGNWGDVLRFLYFPKIAMMCHDFI